MDAKLTLKLDESLIKKAKIQAKLKGTSVSKMVGKFFSTLDSEKGTKEEVLPIIREVSGIIDEKNAANLKEFKKVRLIQKYLQRD